MMPGLCPFCFIECAVSTKIIGLCPIYYVCSKEIVQGAVLLTLSGAEKTLSHPKDRKAFVINKVFMRVVIP